MRKIKGGTRVDYALLVSKGSLTSQRVEKKLYHTTSSCVLLKIGMEDKTVQWGKYDCVIKGRSN
jgi:hypothetical protein